MALLRTSPLERGEQEGDADLRMAGRFAFAIAETGATMWFLLTEDVAAMTFALFREIAPVWLVSLTVVRLETRGVFRTSLPPAVVIVTVSVADEVDGVVAATLLLDAVDDGRSDFRRADGREAGLYSGSSSPGRASNSSSKSMLVFFFCRGILKQTKVSDAYKNDHNKLTFF